jgi:hypothetical protein
MPACTHRVTVGTDTEDLPRGRRTDQIIIGHNAHGCPSDNPNGVDTPYA